MVSFQGPFLESKRKSPFSIRGFWLVQMGKGGAGTVLFFLLSFLPGKVATAAAQLGPQNVPHPVMWPEGQAAWFRLQDSTRRTLAGDSLQPVVVRTVCPGLLLLQGSPAAPPQPPPRFPSEKPASWVVVWSEWGAHPRQDGCDWDMKLTSVLVPWPCVLRVCWQCSAGVWGFLFFLLILPPFSKTGY